MNNLVEHPVGKDVDDIQQRLTDYASNLAYADLPMAVIHAAKVRVIDTLGALMGGYYEEPCRIARNLAARMPNAEGATVIGTRVKTTPDMAAFVNATTARYAELNDVYHGPASSGHASDVLTPVLAAAEYAQSNSCEFIAGVVLAYEVWLRIADVFHNPGYDPSLFCCLGVAAASGKLLKLTPHQLAHCISMAIVPNNILKQTRLGHLSHFKAAGSGQAGRAGVFAAMLAQAGMEGPHLPFVGEAGWCAHVAREAFSLNDWGGSGTPYKIGDTIIKHRAAAASVIPAILAAEKVAPALKGIKDVKQVTIEVNKGSKSSGASGRLCWEPDSRETADKSLPYVTAVTLRDGTVAPRSFTEVHRRNAELRDLMQKIDVVENKEYTAAYPHELHARVTVITHSGEKLVGATGGGADDAAAPKSDAQIAEKFRSLTEDYLGAQHVNAVLDRLWHLEDLKNVAAIPEMFVIA